MSHNFLYYNKDENGRLIQPDDYSDGRTKQAFKDETDINRIMHRAQAAGSLSHVQKYAPVYGNFADLDLLEMQTQIDAAHKVFGDLPSEIRNEFRNSPAAFFQYVNDPANQEDLLKKLPSLAAPGRQNIDVSGKTPPMTPPDVAREPTATETPAADPPPAPAE